MFDRLAFVGSRTTRERNARGEGISCFGIDADGTWTALAVTRTPANPSFLAADRAGRTLYAVHGDGTELTSWRIEAGGHLAPLDRVTTAGLNPVDVVLDPQERFAVVTNHLSDGLTARERLADGRLGAFSGYVAATGTPGPHRTEQTRVKPHQARFFPDGYHLAVPDKGSDTLAVFALDAFTGALRERPERAVRFREGSGPRNVVFHPTLPLLYVVCELDSTLCTLAFTADAQLTPMAVAPARPPEGFGLSRAAAIVVAPDGSRLYVTHRGDDCVAVFPLCADGQPGAPVFRSTQGRTPRFACMDPDGRSLLVANEDSDTIVRLGAAGEEARIVAETGSPVSIVFVAPPREQE